MGKSKKPFINKATAQKFVLLHRSQNDSAHALDERPSDFVLVPADQVVPDGGRHEITSGPQPRPRGEKKRISWQDESVGGGGSVRDRDDRSVFSGGSFLTSGTIGSHVTSLGFKNDGYDYEQHLKYGGGGHLIASDGTVSLAPRQTLVELPQEVLPSNLELIERELGVITISEEFMDEDLKDALFNSDDEAYEEMDDDFVQESLKDPVVEDFDYDAHIANLIMKSERNVTGEIHRGPRGWEDEEGVWEEGSEVSDLGSDEFETESMMARKATVLDDQFEKLMEEYEDEELGDMPFAEERDLQGHIDPASIDEGLNKAFDEALDEFLQEKKDESLATGKLVKSGTKITPLQVHDDIEFDRRFQKEGVSKEEKFKILAKEANDANDNFRGPEEESGQGIFECQEYLREVRVEEKWDCETILSTYSTLENHPTVINDALKPSKPAGRSASSSSSSSSIGGGSSRGGAGCGRGSAAKIVLSGKYDLPAMYVAGKNGSKKTVPSNGSVVGSVVSAAISVGQDGNSRRKLVFTQDRDGDGSLEDGEGTAVAGIAAMRIREGSEEDPSEVYANSGIHEEDTVPEERSKDWQPKLELRKETPEEKRERKSKVKAERREKRATKKEVKKAFVSEVSEQNRIVGARGATDRSGVSVFKYTL